MINIVCTSKPGDGLLCYSYEHCHYLNSIGIKSQVVIITHHNFTIQNYIDSINEKYKTFENVVFNSYSPTMEEITLIMGRSMLTLSYINRKDYTNDQMLTLHLLFGCKLISVYSENHVKEYPLALEHYNPKEVYDLCDYDVYPVGVGKYFQKMILV